MNKNSHIKEIKNKRKDSLGVEKIAKPELSLKFLDVIALVVGIVIGAGIFRTPSLVAANTENSLVFIISWLLGGLISLIGALCYAELTTTFPHTGGDYHFLLRAYGNKMAFLFAWARMSIIQTGSIALLAFIFGDYATQIYSFGPFSTEIYAAIVVIGLTGINVLGVNFGAGAQKLLTTVEVLGILAIITAGFFFAPGTVVPEEQILSNQENDTSFGLAMVFVLLTFGGWNEAAYISAEMHSGRKKMVKALVLGIIIITIIYGLINLALLRVLGISGMAGSEAVAADLMQATFGEGGLWAIGILVAIAAITSANATIFTGARSNYALGRDFPLFSFLGIWKTHPSGPINALLVQGLVALLLIGLGSISRDGFETIVEYTAPVFWFFFFMVGIAIFILRYKEPEVERPFRIPLYPFTPVLFCLSSLYLLYSSIAYTGWGALVGIAVLLVGALLLFLKPKPKEFE